MGVPTLSEVTRLLIRTYRDPFLLASAEDVLEDDRFGGGNNGNLLFSDAAVRTLAVDGVDLFCQSLDRQPIPAAEVNESFDHVVLPFANALSPDFQSRLREYTAFIRELTLPVTVLGIGTQSSFDYGLEELAPLDEDVRAFIAAVLDRSPSIGVRGAFTADYVEHLGFRDVEVIGCPSMFTHGPDLTLRAEPPRPFGPEGRLAFSLNPSLPLPIGTVARLAERYPGLVYFPQNATDLNLVLWGRRRPDQGPGATSEQVDHALYHRVPARVHVNPAAWIADLAGFDLSLGTRIHGNIAAVLAGTPAHVLAHDSRTREIAEHFELPFSRLSDLSDELDLDELTEGNDYTAVSRGHQKRFDQYVAFLESQGLEHVWSPGAQSTWTARMEGRALPLPGILGPETSLDVISRMGWLKRRQDRQAKTASKRHYKQARKVRGLRRRVRALKSSNEQMLQAMDKQAHVNLRQRQQLARLDKRLAALEARGHGAMLRRATQKVFGDR